MSWRNTCQYTVTNTNDKSIQTFTVLFILFNSWFVSSRRETVCVSSKQCRIHVAGRGTIDETKEACPDDCFQIYHVTLKLEHVTCFLKYSHILFLGWAWTPIGCNCPFSPPGIPIRLKKNGGLFEVCLRFRTRIWSQSRTSINPLGLEG